MYVLYIYICVLYIDIYIYVIRHLDPTTSVNVSV